MNKLFQNSKIYFMPGIDIEYSISFYFKRKDKETPQNTNNVRTIISCKESDSSEKSFYFLNISRQFILYKIW